jgi:hypothetical protein
MRKTIAPAGSRLMALSLAAALVFGASTALAEPARGPLREAVCPTIPDQGTYGRCYNDTDCSRICSDWAGTWVQGSCVDQCCYCP